MAVMSIAHVMLILGLLLAALLGLAMIVRADLRSGHSGLITGRVMAILGLLLAGLVGLGMSVCGGSFTVSALLAILHPGKIVEVVPLLIVSVPSLLAGVLVLVHVWRLFKHVNMPDGRGRHS
jgi:hypothetical protein